MSVYLINDKVPSDRIKKTFRSRKYQLNLNDTSFFFN